MCIRDSTQMLRAAHDAGIAFTRSYVGYVHGVAHSLGGQYGVPHGLANAVILPYFLEEYGPSSVSYTHLTARPVLRRIFLWLQ